MLLRHVKLPAWPVILYQYNALKTVLEETGMIGNNKKN